MFFGKKIFLCQENCSGISSNSNLIKKFVQSEISINKYFHTWFEIHFLIHKKSRVSFKFLRHHIWRLNPLFKNYLFIIIDLKYPLWTVISYDIKVDIVILLSGLLHYSCVELCLQLSQGIIDVWRYSCRGRTAHEELSPSPVQEYHFKK